MTCAAVFAVMWAATAAAQGRGVFIQAGPLLDGLTSPHPGRVTTELLTSAAGSVTYRWNDPNGDRRWQPGEEDAVAGITYSETRTSAQPRLAPGALIGIGAFLTPPVSVRIDGALQRARATNSETTPLLFQPAIMSRRAVAITDLRDWNIRQAVTLRWRP